MRLLGRARMPRWRPAVYEIVFTDTPCGALEGTDMRLLLVEEVMTRNWRKGFKALLPNRPMPSTAIPRRMAYAAATTHPYDRPARPRPS